MASSDRSDETRVPLIWHDPILRNGYIGAWILGVVFGALSVLGLIRYPHWIWAAPLATAIVAITVNLRMRRIESRGPAILLGVATLVCVVGAGLLAGLAIRIAH
ncbi:hypothetical protein [Kibdelosporangium aridum]|uniref:hypothetical protein n=1 Tax=Kibdelosporangium aridum TaxID=2030 RepID=UPI000524411F